MTQGTPTALGDSPGDTTDRNSVFEKIYSVVNGLHWCPEDGTIELIRHLLCALTEDYLQRE